jgi:lipoprotein-anchoring transpeptidase ErfK/SrfK
VLNRRPPASVRIAALVLALASVLAACSSSKNHPTLSAGVLDTVTTVKPTGPTLPRACSDIPKGNSLVATASRTGTLNIYARPGAPGAATTMANPFLVNGDPNAPVPLTFLVRAFPPALHCQWIQVYLPVRPNGSTGWIKTTDVNVLPNPYRLEADLREFTLKVFKDDKQIDSIKIGVAKNNTPTPGGIYYLTELIKTPNPDGDYGPFAYGLSGFSNTLTSFNGGPGQLGIHGTNHPELLGTQVSHGCIRMSNDNITKLAHLLPLGTPVRINP